MKLKISLLLLLVPWVGAAFAHHSGAMFDRSQTITLTGTVQKYDFTNPHCWIVIVIPDANEPTGSAFWAVEGNGPTSMQRYGLVPSKLKAGDNVTMRVHPLRDGEHGGSLIDITLANGVYINTAVSTNSDQ
jgi:hypothetical protein